MCDYHCISLVFISPDDRFGRLRCHLSLISTINSPADRTQTQCTLPNRYCICMYVHCVQYMLPSTAVYNRLYTVQCTYAIHSKTYSSSKQHVQLLYMVHCHCKLRSAKGKLMNDCTKMQPSTFSSHSCPFPALRVPLQGWSKQCTITIG